MATYYVRNGGSDSADGLSDANAWATIGKVNGSTFSSDDQILFKRGSVWRETLTPPSSGTSGHPITFGAYGVGDDPLISGADILSSWTEESGLYYDEPATREPEQVFCDGARLVQVDLKASLATGKWWWDSTNSRVYVYDNPSGHTMECDQRYNAIAFSGRDYVTVRDLRVGYAQKWGIDLTTSCNYDIVQGCTIEYNYLIGLVNQSDSSKNVYNTFTENIVRYNGGNGIANWSYTEYTTVSKNIVHHNCIMQDSGTEGDNHNYTGGIKANLSTCKWLTVEYNYVYDNGIVGVLNRGSGIWMDQEVYAATIRYNFLDGNVMDGIQIEVTSGAAVYGNVIANTDGNADGNAAGILVYGRGVTGEAADNNLIYNNTLYGNEIGIYIRGEYPGETGSLTGNIIKNNLVVGSLKRALMCTYGGENDGTWGSGNVYDYNCFGPESSNFIEWGADTYKSTYDAWETAYGGTTHSVEADPQLHNPAAGEFWLDSDSPCIDAGTALDAAYASGLRSTSKWPGQ